MTKLIAVEVFFRDRLVETRVFDRDVVTIGRAPSCDVHLDNAGVSREHCRLERRSGAVVLCDSQSANGSIVNRMRVSETFVGPDDAIEIGKFRLRVTERGAEAASQLTTTPAAARPATVERETLHVDDRSERRVEDAPEPAQHAAAGRAAKRRSLVPLALMLAAGALVGWVLAVAAG